MIFNTGVENKGLFFAVFHVFNNRKVENVEKLPPVLLKKGK